jgi:hypothetical protein
MKPIYSVHTFPQDRSESETVARLSSKRRAEQSARNFSKCWHETTFVTKNMAGGGGDIINALYRDGKKRKFY